MQTIIQFSAPRTGSTLVYNILREIFPRFIIKKTHCYPSDEKRAFIVTTYRHPLDSIASSILRYDERKSVQRIKKEILRFQKCGLWETITLRNNPRALLLRYETFYENHDYIFEELESFFKIKINDCMRNTLKLCYGKESVIAATSSIASFDHYNPTTHFHGKHISVYQGVPFYYKDYFSPEEIQYLASYFRDYLEVFGYSA